MGLRLEIPSYSTLCRRLGSLSLVLWQDIQSGDRMHVVVDATGFKVYGEGEWKVRIHWVGKRRTWRKLYLAVNEANNRILWIILTTNDFKDNEVLPSLMNQIDTKHVSRVTGDGAYDDRKCFSCAEENKVKAVSHQDGAARLSSTETQRKRLKWGIF